jgi:hypothetical protein
MKALMIKIVFLCLLASPALHSEGIGMKTLDAEDAACWCRLARFFQ